MGAISSRVILDTNLWISFLLSQRLAEFEKRLLAGNVRLIFSSHLLFEITDVLSSDRIRKRLRTEDIKNFSTFLDTYAVYISCHTVVDIFHDPKDNYLLGLAIDSQADYLLMGDKDLLILNKIAQTRIINYSDWVKINEEQK